MIDRKAIVWGIMRKADGKREYGKFRRSILIDYMTSPDFKLENTNVDKRGTDWIDNTKRYKKLLKKWKKR